MASKSWSRSRTVQFSQFSTAQLRRRSDPIVNEAGDYTSDGNPSPSKGSRQTVNTAGSVSVHTGPPVSTGETQNVASKRKSTSDERDERPVKRFRWSSSPSESPSPSKSPNLQATIVTSTSDTTAPPHCRADFKAKYKEGRLLAQGAGGSVYAGHRNDDNLPVAIKHIKDMFSKRCAIMELDGKSYEVPLEVALLLRLKPKTGETSAVVALLDWYLLDDELILVLERPVPCVDMVDYLNSKLPSLPENEVKILTRQLVDAFIEVHSKRVFHNDIKLDNILIETGSDVPRVRLIDFGCGMILSEDGFYTDNWLSCSSKAEPVTVLQLGFTVSTMVHRGLKDRDVINGDIDPSLSTDFQDFLTRCLYKNPKDRPTLEELKQHSWLM